MISHYRQVDSRFRCGLVACLSVVLALLTAAPATRADQEAGRHPSLLLVVGAAGSSEYGQQFQAWARRWSALSKQHTIPLTTIGVADDGDQRKVTDRARFQQSVERLTKAGTTELWIVMIGHGTFDRKTAKFNLRGPDVSAAEITEWLIDCRRPLVVVNCSSSSGPFINRLSGKNRTVITATNSGFELNYARFGDYFSQAIFDPASDLDKDHQVSVLEAFLAASASVQDFYEQDARLVTEHALIDDNGDALGTPASWFRGVRAVKKAKDDAAVDGLHARQTHLVLSDDEQSLTVELRARRDQLERDIEQLRQLKDSLDEDEYYARLETLAVPLARIYAGRK